MQTSPAATWSRRVAFLTLQLFVLTFVLHQFAGLPTPVAMRVFAITVLGAMIALALALVALVRIWQDGLRGSRRAVAAIVASALVLAGPAWSLPKLLLEPGVVEVTTDADAPPPFRELAKVRSEVAQQMQAAAGPSAAETANASLTLEPLSVERSAEETFSLVRESVSELGWTIVSATPPAEGQPGFIEAVDRSLLFGVTGDVAVRIRGGQNQARVDVRSASRYMSHDLGGNAERVSSLFQQVETAYIRLEKNEEIARIARLRAERAARIREAREAQARREERQSQRQAYDTVSRQWREPSSRRTRPRTRRSRSQQQRTEELRQFWDSMQR